MSLTIEAGITPHMKSVWSTEKQYAYLSSFDNVRLNGMPLLVFQQIVTKQQASRAIDAAKRGELVIIKLKNA